MQVQFEGVDATVEEATTLLTQENIDFAKRVLTVEKLAKNAVAEAYASGAVAPKEWVLVAPNVRMKGSFVQKSVVSTVDVLKAALLAAMNVVKERNSKLYDRLFNLVNAKSISAQADEWGIEASTTEYITRAEFENICPSVTQVRIEVTEAARV
jgi:hypothetical protein